MCDFYRDDIIGSRSKSEGCYNGLDPDTPLPFLELPLYQARPPSIKAKFKILIDI